MLNFMRQNANSWVMVLLFAIIIFVFAINFGPWAGGGTTLGVPYAAVVNNETISMAEFRTAYASQFSRIKQFRPDYEQAQADKDGLRQIVLEQLVSRELLTQLGTKHNLSVGARTLAEEIKERVFGDADFNKEEYIRRVNAYFQSSVSQFEQQVAKEIVAEQMANLLGTAIYVSDEEAKLAFADKNTKIALEFIKVSPNHFASSGTFEKADIKKYQEAHGAEISAYYNENLSQYIKDEEVKASHILIKVPAGKTAEEKNLLKEKAQKILARAKNKEDFAELAKAESEDVGSKIKGGDLGYFSKGMMVEEFSKAAFALKPGEISDVVESPFGFHIIKVMDAKPKTERKLDDASEEIAELLLKKAGQEEKAKQMAEFALAEFKKGTPLASIKIAGMVNVKAGAKQPTDPSVPVADETDSFNRAAPFVYKIGRIDDLGEAFALTMDNKTAKNIIKVNNDFLAVRLKSREEANMTKFEEEKESLKASLVFPRKRAFMQQFLTALKEKAKITYNNALMNSTSNDVEI